MYPDDLNTIMTEIGHTAIGPEHSDGRVLERHQRLVKPSTHLPEDEPEAEPDNFDEDADGDFDWEFPEYFEEDCGFGDDVVRGAAAARAFDKHHEQTQAGTDFPPNGFSSIGQSFISRTSHRSNDNIGYAHSFTGNVGHNFDPPMSFAMLDHGTDRRAGTQSPPVTPPAAQDSTEMRGNGKRRREEADKEASAYKRRRSGI
jgi:hypothetical protein